MQIQGLIDPKTRKRVQDALKRVDSPILRKTSLAEKQRTDKKLSSEEKQELGKEVAPAALRNDVEKIKELVDAGADLNVRKGGGYTALIWVSLTGQEEVAELLVKGGADVNLVCNDGLTALVGASRNGRKNIVQLLLDNGADINARTHEGMTALMEASKKGQNEVVELLKKHGARE